MGLLFEGLTIMSVVMLIVFVAVLLGLNELSRRSWHMSVAAYVILPITLALLVYFGVLGSPTGKTWFGWVKVVSALIGVYGFMMIRFTKWGETKFAAYFPVSILSINIAEAVYREFEVYATFKTLTLDPGGVWVLGGPWNLFNGVSGILCIITLTGFVGIKASKDGKRDMVWPDMTWMYIIAYTLWNFAYVYNCISTRSMYAGFGILTAALIAEFFSKKGVWLQHRAQILSLYAMFSLSFDYQASSWFQILPTYTENGMMTISVMALVCNLGAFAYMMFVIVRDKKNPLKEELYTGTKYYQNSCQVNGL